MKKGIKDKIYKRFKNIKFSKIILYKNPNEFCRIMLERVNPNHVGILWGIRNRKLHKGSNWIKLGKVYFSFLPVIYGISIIGWLDMLTNYVFKLILSVGVIGMFIICLTTVLLYYAPIKLGGDASCQC